MIPIKILELIWFFFFHCKFRRSVSTQWWPSSSWSTRDSIQICSRENKCRQYNLTTFKVICRNWTNLTTGQFPCIKTCLSSDENRCCCNIWSSIITHCITCSIYLWYHGGEFFSLLFYSFPFSKVQNYNRINQVMFSVCFGLVRTLMNVLI